MKKLISTVLSVIFLLSILHISAFALTFSDADYGDTNLNAALERLTDSGIIMGDDTGTDADNLVSSRAGVPTALLSIPLRYMHTPSEVVCLSDVENTARLMAAMLTEGGFDR